MCLCCPWPELFDSLPTLSVRCTGPLLLPLLPPSRSLSSNLLPFVFLEVPFYLGFFLWFTLLLLLYLHIHLPHPPLHPLFFTITFPLSLSHSLSDSAPSPALYIHRYGRERCPLPTKCIFQWGCGKVNTPRQAQAVGCVLSRTNTKSVTERVHVTCPSAWVRDLQSGECKVDG